VLNENNQVMHVNLTVLRAASDIGKAGIDELSKQSIALFNLKPIERAHFEEQIAFNVIPYEAESAELAYDLEHQLGMELRKIHHQPGLRINAMLAHVPVFYGHSMSIQLGLSKPFNLADVEKMIKKSPVLASAVTAEGAVPTPITHGANQEGVFIGRLHTDKSTEQGLSLWMVADNVHQTAAINSVQIAEILVKGYL
jgi:aspartate-semialdehyde dehydrogenase